MKTLRFFLMAASLGLSALCGRAQMVWNNWQGTGLLWAGNPGQTTIGNTVPAIVTPVWQGMSTFSAGITVTAPLIFGSGPNIQTGATYSLVASDYQVTFNASGSATITLGTATAGRILWLRTIAAQTVVSASSNVVPLAGGSAGTAILSGTAGKWALLQGDGTNWNIIAGN